MRCTLAFVLGFASYGLLRGTQWTRLLTSTYAGSRSITDTATSTPLTCPMMSSKTFSINYLDDLSTRVLNFWFGSALTRNSPSVSKENQMRWFMVNPAFDQQIREQFGADVERALSGHYTTAMTNGTPRTRLALIIMLDQFTRNIYRGTAKMYAGDEQALRVAMTALETYQDERVLHPSEVCFLLLPLEHAESVAAQDRVIKEIYKVKEQKDVPDGMSAFLDEFLKYAHDHGDVIRKFGRYPSRNAILGRTSTPEEIEFLKTHKGW